jgi:cardiolipin synthase
LLNDLLRPETPWLITPLLAPLGFGLALLLMAHLLNQQRSPSSTMAWLLVIVLLPYVGVPLYLTFGGRKTRRMAGRKRPVYTAPGDESECPGAGGATEKILRSLSVPATTAGNRLRLITTGEEAYRLLIRAIDEATTSIDITTYILGTDDVGRAIVDRLARRAGEGVTVRLLLDSVGSWRVRRRSLAVLTERGAGVAFFMPVIHIPFRGRANLRNHRKIIVVDNQRAIIGGMNLSGEYMGPTPDPKRWRDLSLLVEGPAVADLAALFRSDWLFATGEDLGPVVRPAPLLEPFDDGRDAGSCRNPVQVVASGPDVVGDPLYESLIAALFTATTRIWVVTPYFVPDEMLARALEIAARRGVEVILVVPRHSNHWTADLARAGFLRQVFKAGGRIRLYEPVMLHAKALLIDDNLAVIGSANMDMRSLFLNYEVALFLYGPDQVEETAAWVRSLMPDAPAGLPPSRSWAAELTGNVVRLLSPLL